MERCANRQLASENEEPSPSTIKRDWGSLKCSSSATTMDNGLSPKKVTALLFLFNFPHLYMLLSCYCSFCSVVAIQRGG